MFSHKISPKVIVPSPCMMKNIHPVLTMRWPGAVQPPLHTPARSFSQWPGADTVTPWRSTPPPASGTSSSSTRSTWRPSHTTSRSGAWPHPPQPRPQPTCPASVGLHVGRGFPVFLRVHLHWEQFSNYNVSQGSILGRQWTFSLITNIASHLNWVQWI